MSNPATTSAIRFAAPDAHAGDETWQHLNGWIFHFCFVRVRHRDYETSFSSRCHCRQTTLLLLSQNSQNPQKCPDSLILRILKILSGPKAGKDSHQKPDCLDGQPLYRFV